MKRIFLVTLVLTLLCMPALADKYESPQFGWHVDGVAIGFTDVSPDIRGCVYNAFTNHVLVSDDDGDEVAVLSPTDGSTNKIIINADTGDGTVDPFRVEASADGQIFTVGFAGSVKRIGTEAVNDAVASPIIVASASYAAGTGSCRSLFVTGDWSAGTLTIMTARGPILSVWQQVGGAASDVMIEAATIATGFSTEPQGIWARADLTEIIAFRQGTGTKKFVGMVPVYVEDTSYTTPSLMTWRYSIDVNEDKDLIVAGSGHSQTIPGQMTVTAINRYSSGAGIGDGTNGNTGYANYGGIYTWGAAGHYQWRR